MSPLKVNENSRKRMSSLWDRTQRLPNEFFKQVEMVYGDHFPFEVRFQLALWIEENFINRPLEVKPEDPGSQNIALQLAQQLLIQLDQKAESIPDDPDKILLKKKLKETSIHLKNRYNGNLVGLYMKVRQCLESELTIVHQAASMASGSTLEQSKDQKIVQKLSSLKQRVNATGLQLENCRHEQEVVTTDLCSYQEHEGRFKQLASQRGEADPEVKQRKVMTEKMKTNLENKYSGLCTARNSVMSDIVFTVREVKEVQAEVLDNELIAWKREQQLAGNGLQMTLSLETIQEWCESLATIIWSTRQHVKELERLKTNLPDNATTPITTQQLTAEITDLLSNLVTGTFIIEKQPPQVMKTNTRFTATVRLLVGGQLNVHMASPSVSVSIISENQANTLLKASNQTQKRREDYSSGEILNGHGNMEFHAATRQVSVTFRNLQLKRIKRTEKKGTESVMEEKFSVLFWTEFQVSELKFQVWTLSLPVVVIVHGNQEPQALATITWDNAFADWGRPPFRVPDKVSWHKMAMALNMKWTSACNTHRGLTEDNMFYLATKAFRNPNLHRDDFKNLVISWSQFCREPLPDRNFTFWEWFYRIMTLTSNHLRGPWTEGYIMGFASKMEVEQILTNMENGTFILRFSDSELGGVTIAYVRQDPYSGQKQVFMVAPFTTKDLSQRSIADVVFDLEKTPNNEQNLTCVYSQPMPIPLEGFRKFTSQNLAAKQQSTLTGYVPHELKTSVTGPQVSSLNQDGGYGFVASPYGQDGSNIGSFNTNFCELDNSMDENVHNFDPNGIDIQKILDTFNPGPGFENNMDMDIGKN